MKIGKLNVRFMTHDKLGDIFEVKVAASEKPCFEVSEDGNLKMYISQQTALLLSGFIDEELNLESKWKESNGK